MALPHGDSGLESQAHIPHRNELKDFGIPKKRGCRFSHCGVILIGQECQDFITVAVIGHAAHCFL